MGTVYRAKRTKPIPDGAELLTRRGERIATWRDARGRKQTAKLTDDGERIIIESSVYTAKWRDGSGLIRKQSTGCRELATARTVLTDLMKRAENVQAGVRTAAEDSVLDHLATPIGEHVADYLDSLRSKHGKGGRMRVSAMHVYNVGNCLNRIVADCSFTRLRDLNRRRVDRWVREQRAEEHPSSARTINRHWAALNAFGNWCVSSGRLASNPFARPPKLDESSDRRRQRRALTADEIRRLLYVARIRPLAERGRETVHRSAKSRDGRRTWTRKPLTWKTIDAAAKHARDTLDPAFVEELDRTGRERALIYKTLVLTGLRRGELASLTVGQLELDGSTAYIRLNAGDAKSGSGADIPIRADLAGDLREWINDRAETMRAKARLLIGAAIPAHLPRDEPLFNVPAKLIRIMDRDLEAAGIPKRDDRGRTVDVHALRHTFGTHLSKGGVAPRTAQAAMRHSKLDLTMSVYTDPKLLDVAGAMDALPALDLSAKPSDEIAKATGTDAVGTNITE